MSIDKVLKQLYVECYCLSGGYDRRPSFAAAVAFGEVAIPRLLLDIVNARADEVREGVNPWVAMVVLRAILAAEGQEGPALADPEDAGRFEPVIQMWREWADKRGYGYLVGFQS